VAMRFTLDKLRQPVSYDQQATYEAHHRRMTQSPKRKVEVRKEPSIKPQPTCRQNKSKHGSEWRMSENEARVAWFPEGQKDN